MEMSDAQYDHLVSLIADSRVEFRQGISDLALEIRTGFAGMRKNQVVMQSTLDVIDADLQKVQIKQRVQDQALEGSIQLGKTTFDLLESLQKDVHEAFGSSTMDHRETEASRGSGPQQ